jgi:hypothetical protein
MEDIDLLSATRGHLIEAQNECPRCLTKLYWPLRYATAKYGKIWVCNQIIRRDLLIVLIAFTANWPSLLMLPFLYFALMCIYEIGYYENDHHAAKNEAEPTLTDVAKEFAGYSITSNAWCWTVVLSSVGLLIGGILSIQVLLSWGALLIGLRVVFYIYNRTKTKNRGYLYPLLQVFKFCAYVMFCALSPIGLALVFTQISKMVITYWVYRCGGDKLRLSNGKLGICIFAISMGAILLHSGVVFGFVEGVQLLVSIFVLLESQFLRIAGLFFSDVKSRIAP